MSSIFPKSKFGKDSAMIKVRNQITATYLNQTESSLKHNRETRSGSKSQKAGQRGGSVDKNTA
jgi:hypothetical protein